MIESNGRLLAESPIEYEIEPSPSEELEKALVILEDVTDTLDMIRLCTEAGLPEPQFRSEGQQFVATVWCDWLTDEVLAGLRLNKRQLKAVAHLKSVDIMTNAEYREVTGASRPTAIRDLADLVDKGVFCRDGAGRGASYSLGRKRLGNDSNGSCVNAG